MTARKLIKNYSKDIPKNCKFCDEEFLAYRQNSKYCSDTCKWAWAHRNADEKRIKRRKEYQLKWGTENWQRKRDYNLLKTYGLTREQYEELLHKQHYSCGVCGRHETEFSRKLAVDHNHSSGEIYGLLCHDCNLRVIGKRRDPELFLKAAEFLRKGTGIYVPVRKTKPKEKKRKRLKWSTPTTKKLQEQSAT